MIIKGGRETLKMMEREERRFIKDEETKYILYKNFIYYRNRAGLSYKDLSDKLCPILHISSELIKKWGCHPSTKSHRPIHRDYWEALCNVFDISIDRFTDFHLNIDTDISLDMAEAYDKEICGKIDENTYDLTEFECYMLHEYFDVYSNIPLHAWRFINTLNELSEEARTILEKLLFLFAKNISSSDSPPRINKDRINHYKTMKEKAKHNQFLQEYQEALKNYTFSADGNDKIAYANYLKDKIKGQVNIINCEKTLEYIDASMKLFLSIDERGWFMLETYCLLGTDDTPQLKQTILVSACFELKV